MRNRAGRPIRGGQGQSAKLTVVSRSFRRRCRRIPPASGFVEPVEGLAVASLVAVVVLSTVEIGRNVRDLKLCDHVFPNQGKALRDMSRMATVGGFSEYIRIPQCEVGYSLLKIDNDLRLIIVTGGLGGFTTYSSFNYETLHLAQSGAAALAVVNVVITLVGCLAAGIAGIWLARQFT